MHAATPTQLPLATCSAHSAQLLLLLQRYASRSRRRNPKQNEFVEGTLFSFEIQAIPNNSPARPPAPSPPSLCNILLDSSKTQHPAGQ
jgi:hypothetical protein